MNNATILCSCGAYHPPGFICDQAKTKGQCNHKHKQSLAKSASTCCHHHHDKHQHISTSTHQSCVIPSHNDKSTRHCSVSLSHSADHQTINGAGSTKVMYRIVNMDCPTEETLIRKKLSELAGIQALEFNLIQRVLTVYHNLPSTEPIEAMLNAIDMKPELITVTQGQTTLFSITEMDCPTEETLIRSKLASIPGIFSLQFNLMQRTLQIQHDPKALPAISEALYSLQLGAVMMDANTTELATPAAPTIPWRKLALACAFAAASEALELMHDWQVAPLGLNLNTWTINGFEVMSWLPLLFAVIAILLSGFTTYKKGWIAIKNLNLNINALMSVAVTGAVMIGQYPEAAMVMVLFNLAEAIEAKSLDHARDAIKNLLSLTPEKATVLQESGQWQTMDIRQIAIGKRIRVKPGERIALDGVIVLGQSSINQAPITGESMPVEKNIGDTVYAGTINESGSFEFEVSAEATNTTLARIIHAVEDAQSSRAPIQRFVDQFARFYTPTVFLLALLMAVIPPLLGHESWSESIYTALVILVIGCPCALVISTPVTIVSGMAAATRLGILIKGGMFLEQGRLLRWLALDKTGTITYGKPCQTDFVAINQQTTTDGIITIASSIAARSDHPVSRAIAEHATKNNTVLQEVIDFTAIPGQGVSGVINGEKWYLGNQRMVEQLQQCSPEIENAIANLEKQGKTVVSLVGNGGVYGLFAVADTVKQSSIDAISQLKKLGVKTMMLTGDNQHTAEVVAEQVKVDDFKGNLLPEDKLDIIEQLAKTGKVGMVGDGINDAPALARADIGFAMAAAGTDTAIETADVALMDDDLRKIPRFIKLSRSTYVILVQNISLALGVKALFFALTLMGHATMWMAVFADVGTSLLVVANGLRTMRK